MPTLSPAQATTLAHLIALGGTALIKKESAHPTGERRSPAAFSQKGLSTTVIPALIKRGLVAYDGGFNPNATRVRVTEAGASL